MKTNSRGFTLIELLVVIAIIGILASVVLASLNSARDKGAQASVKSSANNMRAQAEIFYDENGTTRGYTGMCTAIDTDNGTGAPATTFDDTIANAVSKLTSGDCDSDDNQYAIQTTLTGTSDYYCVDNTGKVYQGTTAKAAAAVACP